MTEFSISRNIWNILVCSFCNHSIVKTDDGAICTYCGQKYIHDVSGQFDFRLKKSKKIALEFELGESLSSDNGLNIVPLKKNKQPEVDFSDVRVPWHLTEEILSYIPKAKFQGSVALDLGCGDAIHKEACEHAGFEWVGLDFDSPNSLILGDAHSLPFRSDSFDLILSIAVLEHIRFPFVMMRETYRVLKPGGKFIGTVAFLEPFHGHSYYHHTHIGTINSLIFGGFTIDILAPNEQWPVLVAQANMGLFPRLPRLISESIVYPVQLLHKLWWATGSFFSHKLNKQARIRNTAGAFTYIASKGIA